MGWDRLIRGHTAVQGAVGSLLVESSLWSRRKRRVASTLVRTRNKTQFILVNLLSIKRMAIATREGVVAKWRLDILQRAAAA